MTRLWYWFVPALAIAVAAVAIYTIISAFVREGAGIPSLQFLAVGLFVFPGLLIVLAVAQLLLRRRRPMAVTLAERILMVAVALVALLMIATSFDVEALEVGALLLPVLVGVACALVIVIATTNARRDRLDAADSPTDSTATIDDLFR